MVLAQNLSCLLLLYYFYIRLTYSPHRTSAFTYPAIAAFVFQNFCCIIFHYYGIIWANSYTGLTTHTFIYIYFWQIHILVIVKNSIINFEYLFAYSRLRGKLVNTFAIEHCMYNWFIKSKFPNNRNILFRTPFFYLA